MSLTDFTTLGRSGLRISPLCLGTMTFGVESGFGAAADEAALVLDAYWDAGGNFFDCANSYAQGSSETILGALVRERGIRSRAVIATKFTRCIEPGNPNALGNGRKAILLSLEQSLRRLQTDYVDLYWLHSWDTITPVEEVLDTMDGLIASGKVRYFGLSDVPAWYAARAQTLAERDRRPQIVALQMEYSLVERSIEREHLPAMQELGMGLCAWGGTGGGFLTGKYRREGDRPAGEGRLGGVLPAYTGFTDRKWAILDAVLEVARDMGCEPVQVALNWLATQPGSTAPIIGARTLAQLTTNITAADLVIPPELRARLDAASALEPAHPYLMYQPPMATVFAAGMPVTPWAPTRTTGLRHGG